MEKIKETYRRRTGRTPKRVLVVEGELEASIDKLVRYSTNPLMSDEVRLKEEFLDVIRTPKGYDVYGIGLQEFGGRIHKTSFEELNFPEGDLRSALTSLEIGDSLTLHLPQKREGDLISKFRQYFSRNNPVQIDMDPSGVNVTLSVENEGGLHARPSTMIVQHCNRYSSEIHLEYEGKKINARSIMGILTLGISRGKSLTAYAKGRDAKEAVDGLKLLFESRFNED